MHLLYRACGTPNEDIWPGVSSLRDYKSTFPEWEKQSMKKFVPDLDENGVDLLEKMLVYEPGQRISAIKALEHPFFDDLKQLQKMRAQGK